MSLRRSLVVLAAVWTAVVGMSLAVSVFKTDDTIQALVRAEALGAFNKDVAYRRWAAQHGGVYVPVTADTPPSPYLAQVKERDIETPGGQRLTLVNPAYMTRQVHELSADQYGLRGHITSLKPLRPENEPDDWERLALEKFAVGESEVSSMETIDDVPFLRLMRPLAVEERCLKCHAQQGYEVGDLRGGVSVSVPVAPYEKVAEEHAKAELLGRGGLWLLGIVALALGGVFLGRRVREREVAEKEQASLRDQLRQAQKMEAVGMLAGGVAHDFNNLLCIIRSCSGLMLMEMDKDDPRREEAQDIKTASERGAELTHQLLAFSRKQVLEPKILCLNDLITSAEKMLRRLVGEDVEISINLESELGKIRVDPGQMEQVIMNLAVNSRGAMPDGGKIAVETANAVLDEKLAGQYIDAEPGRYVLLTFSDSGHGMDAETSSRIFEPFFSAKAKGEGTGLGLSTVHGIIEQSGGRIRVYSEIGMGTSFTIYLPVFDAEEDTREVGVKKLSEAPGTETIALVEDEGLLLGLIGKVLRRAGYLVLEAAGPKEALKICEEHVGPIDLLVTDVVLPEMNGRELATKFSNRHPEIKVLYMSGYADDIIAHHGVLDEDVEFIQKPFSAEVIVSKVREVLDNDKKVQDEDGEFRPA